MAVRRSSEIERHSKYAVEPWQLKQRQQLPLDIKIALSIARIQAWRRHFHGKVYVSYSGGLDSTVLLHLVRSVLPDCPAVFFDTGLEFPEIRAFVKHTSNVLWLKPEMKFPQVLAKYGYPIISKKIALYVHQVQVNRARHGRIMTPLQRLRLTGIKSDGSYTQLGHIPKKWLFLCDAPFHISERCCDFLKKNLAKKAESTLGVPFVGVRADEGMQRRLAYMHTGCNGWHLRRPVSSPLAFWTHDDIEHYIKQNNLDYCPVYDMGYTRTGCIFCGFGVHMETPNRFELLRKTHPKLWTYCMDKLKMRRVLRYCKITTGD